MVLTILKKKSSMGRMTSHHVPNHQPVTLHWRPLGPYPSVFRFFSATKALGREEPGHHWPWQMPPALAVEKNVLSKMGKTNIDQYSTRLPGKKKASTNITRTICNGTCQNPRWCFPDCNAKLGWCHQWSNKHSYLFIIVRLNHAH